MELELTKIEGLPLIIETVRNLLSTTVGSLGLAVFIFSYLLSKIPQSTLLQSLIARKQSRINWLKEHSSSDESYCQGVVDDIRNAMIFEQATGIYAEKLWRKGLFDLHERTNVSWGTMKRAKKYMTIGADGVVAIRSFTYGDRIDGWFNVVMTWVFLAMATIVLISVFLLKPTVSTIATGIPLCILLYGSAVGAAFQNAPKHAATMINQRLSADHSS